MNKRFYCHTCGKTHNKKSEIGKKHIRITQLLNGEYDLHD